MGELLRLAYRRFYLRAGYWWQVLREQFRGVSDVRRVTIAAANVLGFIVKGDE